MTITRQTGRTLQKRRNALALMLACSALVAPQVSRDASAQTLFPARDGAGTTASGTATSSAANPGISISGAAATASIDSITGRPLIDPVTGQPVVDPNADPNAAAAVTGGIPATNRDIEPPYVEDLNQPYEPDDLPLNPQELPIDAGLDTPVSTRDTSGLRLGTFMLRPSVNQSIDTETIRSGDNKRRRDYLSTTIRGALSSDWSRHALDITGEGIFERNISGGEKDLEPEGSINADLRLDLAGDTVAHITGGYNFVREDNDDPNAIGNAVTQSGVHQLLGGASITRDFGVVRGTAAVNVNRYSFTDAELADGTSISRKDRNRNGIDGRLRLGYELSPALIPFVELSTGHTFYDQKRDTSGYARSSQTYAARTGVEFDFSEKLRGEISTGYQTASYDDRRLDDISGLTFDGNVVWSPQRGTDVNLGLRSSVQDSTTPGQGGWVDYQLTAAVAHELRNNLVARLSGAATLRDFSDTSDETVWLAGAGLTWSINRYLELTGDIEYERAQNASGPDDNTFRAGIGLTLKR